MWPSRSVFVVLVASFLCICPQNCPHATDLSRGTVGIASTEKFVWIDDAQRGTTQRVVFTVSGQVPFPSTLPQQPCNAWRLGRGVVNSESHPAQSSFLCCSPASSSRVGEAITLCEGDIDLPGRGESSVQLFQSTASDDTPLLARQRKAAALPDVWMRIATCPHGDRAATACQPLHFRTVGLVVEAEGASAAEYGTPAAAVTTAHREINGADSVIVDADGAFEWWSEAALPAAAPPDFTLLLRVNYLVSFVLDNGHDHGWGSGAGEPALVLQALFRDAVSGVHHRHVESFYPLCLLDGFIPEGGSALTSSVDCRQHPVARCASAVTFQVSFSPLTDFVGVNVEWYVVYGRGGVMLPVSVPTAGVLRSRVAGLQWQRTRHPSQSESLPFSLTLLYPQQHLPKQMGDLLGIMRLVVGKQLSASRFGWANVDRFAAQTACNRLHDSFDDATTREEAAPQAEAEGGEGHSIRDWVFPLRVGQKALWDDGTVAVTLEAELNSREVAVELRRMVQIQESLSTPATDFVVAVCALVTRKGGACGSDSTGDDCIETGRDGGEAWTALLSRERYAPIWWLSRSHATATGRHSDNGTPSSDAGTPAHPRPPIQELGGVAVERLVGRVGGGLGDTTTGVERGSFHAQFGDMARPKVLLLLPTECARRTRVSFTPPTHSGWILAAVLDAQTGKLLAVRRQEQDLERSPNSLEFCDSLGNASHDDWSRPLPPLCLRIHHEAPMAGNSWTCCLRSTFGLDNVNVSERCSAETDGIGTKPFTLGGRLDWMLVARGEMPVIVMQLLAVRFKEPQASAVPFPFPDDDSFLNDDRAATPCDLMKSSHIDFTLRRVTWPGALTVSNGSTLDADAVDAIENAALEWRLETVHERSKPKVGEWAPLVAGPPIMPIACAGRDGITVRLLIPRAAQVKRGVAAQVVRVWYRRRMSTDHGSTGAHHVMPVRPSLPAAAGLDSFPPKLLRAAWHFLEVGVPANSPPHLDPDSIVDGQISVPFSRLVVSSHASFTITECEDGVEGRHSRSALCQVARDVALSNRSLTANVSWRFVPAAGREPSGLTFVSVRYDQPFDVDTAAALGLRPESRELVKIARRRTSTVPAQCHVTVARTQSSGNLLLSIACRALLSPDDVSGGVHRAWFEGVHDEQVHKEPSSSQAVRFVSRYLPPSTMLLLPGVANVTHDPVLRAFYVNVVPGWAWCSAASRVVVSSMLHHARLVTHAFQPDAIARGDDAVRSSLSRCVASSKLATDGPALLDDAVTVVRLAVDDRHHHATAGAARYVLLFHHTQPAVTAGKRCGLCLLLSFSHHRAGQRAPRHSLSASSGVGGSHFFSPPLGRASSRDRSITRLTFATWVVVSERHSTAALGLRSVDQDDDHVVVSFGVSRHAELIDHPSMALLDLVGLAYLTTDVSECIQDRDRDVSQGRQGPPRPFISATRADRDYCLVALPSAMPTCPVTQTALVDSLGSASVGRLDGHRRCLPPSPPGYASPYKAAAASTSWVFWPRRAGYYCLYLADAVRGGTISLGHATVPGLVAAVPVATVPACWATPPVAAVLQVIDRPTFERSYVPRATNFRVLRRPDWVTNQSSGSANRRCQGTAGAVRHRVTKVMALDGRSATQTYELTLSPGLSSGTYDLCSASSLDRVELRRLLRAAEDSSCLVHATMHECDVWRTRYGWQWAALVDIAQPQQSTWAAQDGAAWRSVGRVVIAHAPGQIEAVQRLLLASSPRWLPCNEVSLLASAFTLPSGDRPVVLGVSDYAALFFRFDATRAKVERLHGAALTTCTPSASHSTPFRACICDSPNASIWMCPDNVSILQDDDDVDVAGSPRAECVMPLAQRWGTVDVALTMTSLQDIGSLTLLVNRSLLDPHIKWTLHVTLRDDRVSGTDPTEVDAGVVPRLPHASCHGESPLD